MNTSKIILTLEDNLLGCELNDSQGHILDKQERLRITNALDSLHQLFLKHLKTK